jgi:hypothetical protein
MVTKRSNAEKMVGMDEGYYGIESGYFAGAGAFERSFYLP